MENGLYRGDKLRKVRRSYLLRPKRSKVVANGFKKRHKFDGIS
jgi:hypothetical protein